MIAEDQAEGALDLSDLGYAPSHTCSIYFATAIHPTKGRVYRLEGNIDFDGQVNTIAHFHLDPMTSRQHLGLHEFR